MAVIAPSTMSGPRARTVVENTLTASDTFVYSEGTGQVLILRNPTAGALSVTITGDAAVFAIDPNGGSTPYQNGYTPPAIAASTGYVAIPLDTIRGYLRGNITVTNGTGLKATLLTDLR